MSVLSALRTCLASGSLPRVEGDVVRLSPDTTLPRKLATAWRYRKGGYLDLESIAFFLNNERLVLSQYVKACSDADVQIVPFAERKPLLEYLRGGKDSTAYHQIDQDREQKKKRNVARRASESASIRSDIAAMQLLSRPPSSGLRASRLSTSAPIRIPRWAWWWLLLSSIVMAVNAAYILLRPLLPQLGLFDRYFVPLGSHTPNNHTATATPITTPHPLHNDASFTRTVAILLTTLRLLNITTIALHTALPTSSWPALSALVVSAGTLYATVFNLLYRAVSASGSGGMQRLLLDVSKWDVGAVAEFVGSSVVWIAFPLAIVVIVGGQFVRAAAGQSKVDRVTAV